MLDQVEMESMSELTWPSDMGIMWLEWEERASLEYVSLSALQE